MSSISRARPRSTLPARPPEQRVLQCWGQRCRFLGQALMACARESTCVGQVGVVTGGDSCSQSDWKQKQQLKQQ